MNLDEIGAELSKIPTPTRTRWRFVRRGRSATTGEEFYVWRDQLGYGCARPVDTFWGGRFP